MSLRKRFRLALIQMQVSDLKTANLDTASKMVKQAVSGKADMIMLPVIKIT